jgi:hypothetical protein
MNRIMVTAMTTKPQILISISSAVSFWGLGFNLLLQYRGYEIFRALLCKQALGLLALLIGEMLRVLADIPITVFAGSKASHCKGYGKENVLHLSPQNGRKLSALSIARLAKGSGRA